MALRSGAGPSSLPRVARVADMDVLASLIELKPGTEERVQEWAEFLRERRIDAIETLANEGVHVESWFAVTLDGKRYLLCYMRAASMKRAQAVAERSASVVDVYHQRFKEDTWVRGRGAVGQLLVDLAHDPGARP